MRGAISTGVTRWLVSLVLAVGALGAGVGQGVAIAAPASAAGAVRVAQAPPDPVAVAAAEVTRAEQGRSSLAGQRTTLDQRYATQLAEIDKLKRQKASWRRDRALRSKLAESIETAQALARLASDLAAADAELGRARARGVAAIDLALATAIGPRKAELTARRRQWAPPPRIKRIVIPDDSLDPLADPDDLEDQAAALADSEAELGREVARLDVQAARFDRLATLRKQHDRAEELVLRDDADPRPGVASAGGALATADPAPSGIGEDAPVDASFERDATALSAVIDPSTVDVLRSAERSNDPARRAVASRAARDAVATRLASLKKQRAAIEARARELRRTP